MTKHVVILLCKKLIKLNEYTSDTKELYGNREKRFDCIDTKKTKCAYGLLSKNSPIELNLLKIDSASSFAVIALSTLTEKDAYVLDTECDGATYHSGKSTRDRDRLRQEVLERLGWTFYRIWSTDWFKNNVIEKKKLLDYVEKAIRLFEWRLDKDVDFTAQKVEKNKVNEEFAVIVDDEKAQELRDFFTEYKEADINALIKKHYNHYFDRRSFLEDVIRAEQPIMEELLLRKAVPAFGREKVTNGVRAEFVIEIKRSTVAKKIKGFWTTDISAPITLRVPSAGMAGREISMICKEEIADGFEKIIRYNIGISKEGLFRAITNLLGFTRLGENITQRLEEALNLLLVVKSKETKAHTF